MSSAVELLFSAGNIDAVKAQVLGLVPIFERVAKAGKASAETSARDQVRAQTSALTAIDRAEKETAKAKDRAAKDATRAVDREAREQLRIKNAVNALEVRDWRQKEQEKTRALETEERTRTRASEDAARHRASIARATGRGVVRASGRVLGTAGRVAGMIGAIGGGFTLADSLSSGVQNEAAAGQIVRSAAEKGGITGAMLQQSARSAAIATGGKSEDMLAGVDAFVQKNGDLKTAVDLLGELSKEAASSGAKLEDLGSTAAEVFSQVGDKAKTVDVMRTLIGQGKSGAIDVRQLGQYGARLTSTAGLFEGGNAENIKTFGALAQVAKSKGGATDAAEATEAALRVFDEIAQHKDEFQSLGVKVKGSGGKLRGVQDILLDTLVNTKGDITAIPKLFGRQAGKLEVGLGQAFLEGSGGKTDRASLEAGRAHAAELISSYQKPVTQEELDADVKDKLRESNSKLNIAMEKLHQAINEKLLLKLPELIDAFTQLIPVVAKAVGIFADFPAASIATLIGGSIVAEIGKSKLGDIVAAAIAKRIGGGGGGGSGDPPTPGSLIEPGSKLELLGKMGGITENVTEYDKKIESTVGDSYTKRLMANVGRSGELTDKINAGTATPEEKDEAQQRLRVLSADVAGGKKVQAEGPVDSLLADAKALGGVLGGGDADAQNRREQEKAAAKSHEKAAAAADELRTALDKLAASASNVKVPDGSWPNPNP